MFRFPRYIFARFGGVTMNGEEEPGGGDDWTCNPTGGFCCWIFLLNLTSEPRRCSRGASGRKSDSVLSTYKWRRTSLGFLVLPPHSHKHPPLCLGSQVADSFVPNIFELSRDLRRDCDCSNGLPDAKEVVTSIFSSFMELLLLLLCLLPLVFGTKVLWTVLVVITCALALRETLQMFASLKRCLITMITFITILATRYLLSLENWLELLLLSLLAFLLFAPDNLEDCSCQVPS